VIAIATEILLATLATATLDITMEELLHVWLAITPAEPLPALQVQM
jgi:hypothetical protein